MFLPSGSGPLPRRSAVVLLLDLRSASSWSESMHCFSRFSLLTSVGILIHGCSAFRLVKQRFICAHFPAIRQFNWPVNIFVSLYLYFEHLVAISKNV